MIQAFLDFSLVDVPSPFWGVSISLPNSRLLAVLFTDRGMVKRELIKKYKNMNGINKWLKKMPVESTQKLTQLVMLKLLITQYQIENIPYKYYTMEKKILSGQVPNKTKYKKNLRREIFVTISNNVGLGAEYGNDIYKSYLAQKEAHP